MCRILLTRLTLLLFPIINIFSFSVFILVSQGLTVTKQVKVPFSWFGSKHVSNNIIICSKL